MLVDDKQARDIAECIEALRRIEPTNSPYKAAFTMEHAANLLESLSAQVAELQKENRKELAMGDDQIKHMVDRFLGWRLPEHFSPDGGISFKANYNERTAYPAKHEPTGTNLFDAMQAEAMIRYLVDGMPAAKASGVSP